MATADAADYPPVGEARDELQVTVSEAAETLRALLHANDEHEPIRAVGAILHRPGISKGKQVSATSTANDVDVEPSTFDGPIENLL